MVERRLRGAKRVNHIRTRPAEFYLGSVGYLSDRGVERGRPEPVSELSEARPKSK